MRNVTDLPVPGAPVMRAKPPVNRMIRCAAWPGELRSHVGADGFHLSPYKARCFLLLMRPLHLPAVRLGGPSSLRRPIRARWRSCWYVKHGSREGHHTHRLLEGWRRYLTHPAWG